MSECKTFVLSLARATERREFMLRQMEGVKMDCEIFEAIDGKTLAPEDYAVPLNDEFWRKKRGWALTPGEIGCFLSHYALWKKIVSEKIPHALILEDDAEVSFCFDKDAREILECKTKWDIIILHPRKEFKHTVVEDLPGGRRLVRFHRRVGGTVAYFIRREAAQKLLQICGEMRAPIDWMYAEWWRNGLEYFAALPAPVRHRPGESIIKRAPKLPRTIGEYISGAWWRFCDYRLRQRMIRERQNS